MTIHDILEMSVIEREKGAKFERLMKRWLKTDSRTTH